MNYSELLQLAKGWSNFIFYRTIIWRLHLKNRFPETGKSVDDVEIKLDEADRIAETTEERLSHDDVFRSVRSMIRDK